MPAVLDTPALLEHIDAPALPAEPLPTGAVRTGFWRTLMHWLRASGPTSPRAPQALACRLQRPVEAPIDRLIREQPAISIRVLAML